MLVPGLSVILQLPGSWHDRLVTAHTFGGELAAVAVIAEEFFVLAREGLVCQRAVAAEAPEAVFVVMAILVVQFPRIMANQLLAFITGVGKMAVIAGDAVRAFFHLNVLPPIQGLFAVVAVKRLTHGSDVFVLFLRRITDAQQRPPFGTMCVYSFFFLVPSVLVAFDPRTGVKGCGEKPGVTEARQQCAFPSPSSGNSQRVNVS